MLSDVVDGMGHIVTFQPVSHEPPYRAYRLTDGTGRSLRLDLEDRVTYLDGDRPGGTVEVYLVTRVTDETRPNHNAIDYKYQDDRLIEVSYPGHANRAARLVKYDYDDRGNLVRIIDPVGDTFSIEYLEDPLDSDERLISRLKVSAMSDSEGNSVRYHYDHPNTRVVVTLNGINQPTHTLLYTYIEDDNDTRQRLITSEDIEVTLGYSGKQTILTQWGYTEDGRLLLSAVTDPLSNKSTAEYNSYNQIIAQIDPTGHQRNFTYDLQAAPSQAQPNRYDLLNISETNIDVDDNVFIVQSSQTFNSYDAITSQDPADPVQSTHRIASQTDELGNTKTFAYGDAANFYPLKPSNMTDPLGKATARSYDSVGNLLQETDADNNTRSWSYNTQSQLVAETDPNGFRRFWVYDKGTRWLTDTTDALGAAPGDAEHSIHYEYNDAGQITRRIDGTKSAMDFTYSGNKRLVVITRYDPVPRRIALTYEPNGTLTSITDASGHVAHFSYDEAARLYESYRDGPGGRTTRVVRDAAGRPTSSTDCNGQVTEYGHDSLGRLTTVKEPSWPAINPANPGKTILIKYDYLSHVLSTTDSQFAVKSRNTYDASGNLTNISDHFGWSLACTYDARHDLIRLSDAMREIDVTFSRDDTGRLSTVVDSDYLDSSRTFRFIRKDGVLVDNLYRIEVDATGIASRFQYNPNRQLTLAAHEVATAPLSTYGYVYRADGRIRQATGDHQGTYQYDGLKQLIAETDSGVVQSYDAAGNRLWRSPQEPPAGKANVYDSANRIVNAPSSGMTFEYDNNGNMIARKRLGHKDISYTFDGGNRLMSVEDGASVVAYLYSFDGRLLQRTVTNGKNNETERYRYAGSSIVSVADAQNETRLIYTRDDRGRLLRRRSTTTLNPLSTTDPHSLFYLHDGIGNVCRLLDWDALVRLPIDYDAWGGYTENGIVSPPEAFRFRQGYYDRNSQLIKFGLRWYDASLGRWISEDPLALSLLTYNANLKSVIPDLINLYAYALNDPLNVSDFSGLTSFLERLRAWGIRWKLTGPMSIPEKWDKGEGLVQGIKPGKEVAEEEPKVSGEEKTKGGKTQTERVFWGTLALASLVGIAIITGVAEGVAVVAGGAVVLGKIGGESEAGATESGAPGSDGGGSGGDGGSGGE